MQQLVKQWIEMILPYPSKESAQVNTFLELETLKFMKTKTDQVNSLLLLKEEKRWLFKISLLSIMMKN